MSTPPLDKLGLDLLSKVADQIRENEAKDDECPICMDSLTHLPANAECRQMSVQKGDPCRVVRLWCGHRFHYACLVRYICDTVVQGGSMTRTPRKKQPLVKCPLCQQPFLAKTYLLDECLEADEFDDNLARAFKYGQLLRQAYSSGAR